MKAQPSHGMSREEVTERLADVLDLVAMLQDGITRYATHAVGCEFGPALRCTCGYLDFIRGLVEMRVKP